MIDDNTREMTLKEVAKQFGCTHGAFKSYELLLSISKELEDCGWWQVFRRRELCMRFQKEMRSIADVR